MDTHNDFLATTTLESIDLTLVESYIHAHTSQELPEFFHSICYNSDPIVVEMIVHLLCTALRNDKERLIALASPIFQRAMNKGWGNVLNVLYCHGWVVCKHPSMRSLHQFTYGNFAPNGVGEEEMRAAMRKYRDRGGEITTQDVLYAVECGNPTLLKCY